MYAIVKTGGKQYRVQEGESLLVERLPVQEGETVALSPLLVVDGSDVKDGEDLAQASVSATVVAHERGPKLRIVKFKPKRGYKRRTGHRQELTRIQITDIKLSGSGRRSAPQTAAASAAATPPSKQEEASDGS
jgi:large subunit ribosomal protein L21